MKPYNPVSAQDYIPRTLLRQIQLQRLQKIVEHEYTHVEFYRKRMDEHGVKPSDIKTLEDVAKLPFMMKKDLRDTYPFGLFALPMKDVVRLHASSGTTGKPIVVGYSQSDIDVWVSCMMRALAAAGIEKGDIIQNSYGYGLFTGGLGAHYGVESLGATVVPTSGGNTERQIMLMRDFGVTGICCTPSYFIHLCEKASQMGIDLKKLPIRVGVFGAEPWSAEMRKHIEDASGIEAFDIYGLSEMSGPGVGVECDCHDGLHIFEDHFYPEIIDPETLEVLPDGEEGELVFTTLSKYAMPMVRYRTRDITKIISEPCSCGRTLRRIARISRRSDDMFIIRGVNVFPSQIESALLSVEGALPHYRITLTRRPDGLDNMLIEVEIAENSVSDQIRVMEALQAKFSHAVESVIGIRSTLKIVPPNTIPRSEGKAKRVYDLRNAPNAAK